MSHHMATKEKKQTINELRVNKVFSIHDCYYCRESKLHRKQTDVDVSADPKTTKPIPTLALPENLASATIVHKACSDLATRCNWTWDQALERTMPDHVATRTIDLKKSIIANSTEDTKFQTSFAFFVCQECDVEKHITS